MIIFQKHYIYKEKHQIKMTPTNIISIILQRYKILCARYSKAPSFIPNTKGDSFYLIHNNTNKH